MEATIKDNKLTLTFPIEERESKSGKTLLIASSGGNKESTAEYKGQKVIVGLNAYIYKEKK